MYVNSDIYFFLICTLRAHANCYIIRNMPKIAQLTVLGVTLCLSGCFSIDRATLQTSGEEHILVSNYGWSLFGQIPLCCGNANADGLTPWVFFRDDVTMDKIQHRLSETANKSGKRLTNLVYRNNDNILFSVPLTEIDIPIPYLICYREIQLSGVMK